MAIQGKRIWLGSWNCENQVPPIDQLNTFIQQPVRDATYRNEAPNLILLGFQELYKKQHMRGTRSFPHERIAKDKPGRLGHNRIGMGRYYTDGGSVSEAGWTKGKRNYQQLGLLVRDGENLQNLRTGKWMHSGKVAGHAMAGKGCLYVIFDYEGRRIAVISCHLESKSAQKQKQEIDGILRVITGEPIGRPETYTVNTVRQRLRQDFYAVFFMGDLNYRLCGRQIAHHVPAPVPMAGMQVRLYTQGDVPRVLPGQNLCATILNAAGREHLITNYDQLLNSPLVRDYGFEFPFPRLPNGEVCFPTYKREYQNRQVVPRFIGQRTLPNALSTYKLRANQNVKTSSSRGYAWDMGWLDRVGIIAGNGPINARLNYTFSDAESINLSDHSPVLMKVTFV